MAVYESISGWQWLGYVVGGITIAVGVAQITVGCLDHDWKRSQVRRYRGDQTGTFTAPAATLPQQQVQYIQEPVVPQQTYHPPEQAYPSLASNAGLLGQPQPQTSPVPDTLASQSQPSAQPSTSSIMDDSAAAAAASDQANKDLAIAAAAVTGRAMFGGASQEDALMSAAQDRSVQKAAANAATAAAAKAVTSAYDRIFEDE